MSQVSLTEKFAEHQSSVQEEPRTQRDAIAARTQELGISLAAIRTEVSEVKEQVNGELGQMNGELGRMNGELGEVKVRLDRLERETLGEMQARLGRIEKRGMNATKVNPYDKVEMIGRYIHDVGYQEPTFFPKLPVARDFWKLKQIPKDKNTRDKNMQRLTYLVGLYGIDDYHHWGKTYSDWDVTDGHSDEGHADEGHSDEGESQSDSSLSMSLADAVAKYPSLAVDKLAAVLGLVEDNFTEFRRKAARYKERPQQPLEKRLHLQADHVSGEEVKRPRVESPQLPKRDLSLQDFMLPDTKPVSSPSIRVTYWIWIYINGGTRSVDESAWIEKCITTKHAS